MENQPTKRTRRLPKAVRRTLIVATAALCVCLYLLAAFYVFVWARYYITPRENSRADFFTDTALHQYLEEMNGSKRPSRRASSAVRDYTPRVNREVTVGETIKVSITVASDATPNCFFQNISVPLTRKEKGNPEKDAVYTGKFKVPEEAQGGVFGAVEFVVEWKGHTEIITAAVLHDVAAQKTDPPQPLRNKDGTYRFIELLEEAESYDGQSQDNKNTTLSPYPVGTIDYVCGENSYTDSSGNRYRFLLLGSGRRICVEAHTNTGDHAVKIRHFNGKKPPKNTLRFDRTDVNSKTELYLDMDWRVPIDVSLHPQLYFSGYQNRPYHVERFSATYIDIRFYYTQYPQKLPSLENSPLFTRAEWKTDHGGQTILRLYLSKSSEFAGYELDYTLGGQLCLSFRHLPSIQKTDDGSYSLAGVRIAIDAGHGGNSPGAVSTLAGEKVLEKDHTRKISDQLIRILEARGATVLDVRPGDTQMDQSERSRSARAFDPDLLISIHLNAAGNGIYGAEGYYYYAFSQPLSELLQQALDRAYPDAMGYRPPDRDMRVRYYPFAVTRVTAYPSVLMELGYMDNPRELERLCDPEAQKKLAQGLANGIVDYLK